MFLYSLALLFLLSGVASFYYKEAEATALKIEESVFHQKGYGSSRGFDGSHFRFALLKYSYTAGKESEFTGLWLKISLKHKISYDSKSFYNPYLPMVSVKERGVPVFWVGLFLVLGFVSWKLRKLFH